MWDRHSQRQRLKWQNLLAKYISVDPGKKLHFSVRMYEVVLLRELSSTLETYLSLQEYQQGECKSLIQAQ